VHCVEEWDSLLAAAASPGLFAFYSSTAGAITTNPERMTLPIDDHAIVRGHAVFDTASLVGGRLYRLEAHLQRLLKSASAARLKLPFGEDAAANVRRMAEVVRATCVAAGRRDASVRYWLTAGPGNFGLTPTGCTPAFYVVVFGGMPFNDEWTTHGVREATVPEAVVPLKPDLLAELKSNNYMLNAMTAMEAQARGGTFGIAVDSRGLIRESCALNVVVVGKDRRLRTPPFRGILAGTTVTRAMQLSAPLLASGVLASVAQEEVPIDDARAAAEIILMAGDTHVFAVTSLDGVPVGDGRVGRVARALEEALVRDAREGTECHDLVPEL